MKKSRLFAIITLLALLAPSAALATEFKVYYSEPIGAGEKVYHLTSCEKTPSYGALYCSEETKDVAPKQCEVEGKLKNVPIKGCEVPGKFADTAGIYPLYDSAKYHLKDPQGCSDKPEKQGFFYAPEFAIVDAQDNIKGTVIHTNADVPQNVISAVGGTLVKPLYRSTLCTTWDVLVNKDGTPGAVEPANLDGIIKSGGDALITAGCNNDNSTQAINGKISTTLNAERTYSCSIVERITGESGSDILGKYISALYRWAASLVGIVAVLTMVYSGIQISIAGGDTAKLDSAKHRIMQSIIGLAILFLSGLILYTINPTFFTG